MSITFTRNNTKFELDLDGTVKADGADFGTWTTDEDNALQITADDGGGQFTQPARWSTKQNGIFVKPEDGDATEFIDATDGKIQFRLNINNRLVIDPFPEEDDFSFTLTGEWGLADDFSSIQLKTGADTLVFTGGLHDSESRFSWEF